MSVVGGCAADATAVVSWLGRAVPYVPRSGSGPSVYLAGSDQGLTKIPKVRRRPKIAMVQCKTQNARARFQ